ncbi:hypothetical protein FTV88_1908 [Heliorestis convoluta]|uniref:Uncharacterized protein n=1 Tax=Heliorestis convoluta TaxID=356322 RepID=A0A5Q2N340_9FIRM|nr:hypothetical protein FTV88_1908 [Heliorestis convoluta]
MENSSLSNIGLMAYGEEIGYEKAYEKLKSIRSIVCPDRRFRSIIQSIIASNQNR